MDIKPRKNAKTVNQFRIKQRLQMEQRKVCYLRQQHFSYLTMQSFYQKHANVVGEIEKQLVPKVETPRQPENPSVLDRFKPRPEKKGNNKK